MKRKPSISFILSALLLLTACLTFAGVSQKPEGRLYAGTARVDITPPIGINLAGYEPRAKLGSASVHDSLSAKILVLEAGGERLAIITCDLIFFYNKQVLDRIHEKYGITRVLIPFSHTHSGPVLEDSNEYSGFVAQAMVDGVGTALSRMFPARISATVRSFPQLGYNRMTNKTDLIAMWQNYERIPYGPVDPEVGVIKVEDDQGNPRAILMQYACHPVTNGHNMDISADYPGVAVKKVEEAFGRQVMCMFVQGGAGDINPMFMTGKSGFMDYSNEKIYNPPTDYSQMEKMGTLLADEVIRAANGMAPCPDAKASITAMADSMKFTGRFRKDLVFDIHITTVLINGQIAIAAFPGEPFVAYQLFWKANAAVAHPFFFGYTFSSGGTHPGYLCDIRSAAHGGYEVDASPDVIEVGSGEIIMNRHLINLYRMKGLMRDTPLTIGQILESMSSEKK